MTETAVQSMSERFGGDLAKPVYQIGEWMDRYGIAAGITGREGRFDLALWSADAAGSVFTRWRAFREAMGTGFEGIAVSSQRHGTDIATHSARFKGLLVMDGIDGHATRSAGVLLAVTVADCVPVYLVHPPTKTLALLHAGWRGVAGGIVEIGIGRVRTLADCEPADIVMHCGVSICGDCYEVGSEVLAGVTGQPAQGTGYLDLRSQVGRRAATCGIRHLTCSPWCTAHDGDRFYSHRGSGGTAGRMVAYLGQPVT